MFEADTSGLKKGTKEGEDGAKDLAVAMQKADAQAKKTSANFSSLAKGAIGIIAAAKAGAMAVSAVLEKSVEIDVLDKLSERIGINVTDTDSLSRSIVNMGGSFQEVNRDIENMAQALGKGGKDPLEEMMKTADKVQAMSLKDATKKLGGMGVTDKRTIDLMRKGRAEVQRLMKAQKDGGAVSKKTVEENRKLKESMQKLESSFSDASGGLLASLIPIISKLLEAITKAIEWVKENKAFVIGFFSAIALVIMAVYVPSMVAAAAATLAATWPLLLIIAIVVLVSAAIALLVDDIYNFIEGNDSLIGQVLKDYPEIEQAIRDAIETIKEVFNDLLPVIETLGKFFSYLATLWIKGAKLIWEAVKKYFGFIAEAFGKIKDAAGSATDWIKEKIGMEADVKINRELDDEPDLTLPDGFSGIKFKEPKGPKGWWNQDEEPQLKEQNVEGSNAGRDSAREPFKRKAKDLEKENKRGFFENMAKDINKGKQQVAQNSANPGNSTTSAAISNQKISNTQNNESNSTIGQIFITTQADDAKGISEDLKESLSKELEKMMANGASPIAR